METDISQDNGEIPSTPHMLGPKMLLLKWTALTSIPAIIVAAVNSAFFWYCPLYPDGGFGPRLLVSVHKAGVYADVGYVLMILMFIICWSLDVFSFPGTKSSSPGGCTFLLWTIFGFIFAVGFYVACSSYPYIPLFFTIFALYPIIISSSRRVMKYSVDESWKNLGMLNLGAKTADLRFAGHAVAEALKWREDKLRFYQGFAISSGAVGFSILGFWGFIVFSLADAQWDPAIFRKMSRNGLNADIFLPSNFRVVQFTFYLAPALTGICLIMFSFLGSLRVTLQREYAEVDSFRDLLMVHLATAEGATCSDDDHAQCEAMKECTVIQKLSQQLHYCICALLTMVITIYYAVKLAGNTSISSIFNAFAAMFLVFLAVMLYMNMRKLFKGYAAKLESMPVLNSVMKFRHNDWFHALVLIFTFPIIPFYAVASFCNQRVRNIRGYEDVGEYDDDVQAGWFTKRFQQQLLVMKRWNLTKTLVKVYYWGVIFFFMTVGVNLLLNITLATIREKIESWNFWVVIVVWFLIGLLAFALPPVPGPPVYLFGGVIIVNQIGVMMPNSLVLAFLVGNVITIVLSTLLKITACMVQQKLIGEPLGSSTKIRRMVGVHQPVMRAIEMILKEPGLKMGKVAILCGGPDWPTSVLCGILRVPVKEVLIGTLPIIIFIVPVVLTGSFALKSDEGRFYSPMSNLMFAVGMLLVAVMGLAATSAIQDRYNRFHKEISIPRLEFLELDWETFKAERKDCTFWEINTWKKLDAGSKILLSFIAISQAVCGFLWLFASGYCFEKFEVTDATDELSWNIIKLPGILGLSLSALSIFVYLAVLKPIFRFRTRSALRRVEEESETMRAKWQSDREALRIAMEKEISIEIEPDNRYQSFSSLGGRVSTILARDLERRSTLARQRMTGRTNHQEVTFNLSSEANRTSIF